MCSSERPLPASLKAPPSGVPVLPPQLELKKAVLLRTNSAFNSSLSSVLNECSLSPSLRLVLPELSERFALKPWTTLQVRTRRGGERREGEEGRGG